MLYFSKSRWFAEVLERPCSAGAPAAFSDEAFFDHIKWIIVIFRLVRDGDATEGRGRPSVRRPGLLTPRLFQRGARETFRVAILVYTRFGRVRGSNRCSASADGECKPMKFMLMGFETPPSWYGYRGSWGSNTTTEQQPSAVSSIHFNSCSASVKSSVGIVQKGSPDQGPVCATRPHSRSTKAPSHQTNSFCVFHHQQQLKLQRN